MGFDADGIDLGVEHAFAFDPEAEFELVAGEIEVVVGLVEGSAGVEIAAGAGDEFIDGASGDIGGAFEHEMFEEVSEARAIGSFVFAPDVIEDVSGNDWGGVIFVEDDMETIGEIVFDELDGFDDHARWRSGSGIGGVGGGGEEIGEGACGASGESEDEVSGSHWRRFRQR